MYHPGQRARVAPGEIRPSKSGCDPGRAWLQPYTVGRPLLVRPADRDDRRAVHTPTPRRAPAEWPAGSEPARTPRLLRGGRPPTRPVVRIPGSGTGRHCHRKRRPAGLGVHSTASASLDMSPSTTGPPAERLTGAPEGNRNETNRFCGDRPHPWAKYGDSAMPHPCSPEAATAGAGRAEVATDEPISVSIGV